MSDSIRREDVVLKVGDGVVLRDGDKKEIVTFDNHPRYPYWTETGCYTETGIYEKDWHQSPFDIVAINGQPITD